MCLAAMNGHTKVVKKMMKIRAVDVNKPVWVTGATPFYLASQYGHAMCVKYLLENRNIRVNQSRTDEGEAAPLHIAAQNVHDEVMKLLLMSSGIKVNAVLTEGDRTALFVAAYYGHEKNSSISSRTSPNSSESSNGRWGHAIVHCGATRTCGRRRRIAEAR